MCMCVCVPDSPGLLHGPVDVVGWCNGQRPGGGSGGALVVEGRGCG